MSEQVFAIGTWAEADVVHADQPDTPTEPAEADEADDTTTDPGS